MVKWWAPSVDIIGLAGLWRDLGATEVKPKVCE